MRHLFTLVVMLLFSNLAMTQNEVTPEKQLELTPQRPLLITFDNPSFEDSPQHSKVPTGWINCGWYNESPPDIQPNAGFNVTKAAADGNTYIGMVTRDNNTWEGVSQKLSQALRPGICYHFELMLATSRHYMSLSRTTYKEADFIRPIRLRIWGGLTPCSDRELLDESGLVTNNEWLSYHFKFQPRQDIAYIMIEAFYETSKFQSYNGNVLVDKASSITVGTCRPFYLKKIEDIRQPSSANYKRSRKMLDQLFQILWTTVTFTPETTDLSAEAGQSLQFLVDEMKLNGHTNTWMLAINQESGKAKYQKIRETLIRLGCKPATIKYVKPNKRKKIDWTAENQEVLVYLK